MLHHRLRTNHPLRVAGRRIRENLWAARRHLVEKPAPSIDAGDAITAALTAASAAELQAARLEIGRLETVLHERTYSATMTAWRYRALCREHWGKPQAANEPPREIPVEMLPRFSMNGRAEIEIAYGDQTRPENWPLIYTDAEIDAYRGMVVAQQWFIYGMTDRWLWQAFAKHSIGGLRVAVMGSTTPWYEATTIQFGGRPVTIEYNKIISRSTRLETVTPAEIAAAPQLFDAAISISSFEHDGLGQYGDPLDPDGDLRAMQDMKRIVRPGGLLYLAVPVGNDKVIFNQSRVYGHARWPLFIEGWTVVDRFGWRDDIISSNGHTQPVVVLRNNI